MFLPVIGWSGGVNNTGLWPELTYSTSSWYSSNSSSIQQLGVSLPWMKIPRFLLHDSYFMERPQNLMHLLIRSSKNIILLLLILFPANIVRGVSCFTLVRAVVRPIDYKENCWDYFTEMQNVD
jgi:hypothetical protein